MRTLVLAASALVCVGCISKTASRGDSAAPATATLAGGAVARDSAVDRRAIDQARDLELTTLHDPSPQNIAALWTDDVVIMSPDEKTVVGRDSAALWLKGVTDQFSAAGAYGESKISVLGDVAIERYLGELTLTPKKGGKAVQEHFKGIHIYRRQSDGSWRIAEDIWNSVPAPKAEKGR